ncbi:tannase and feruloyl esterase [Aureobasidium pullulans]|nr:tannase and feruloyl esterase [Aureobasidium pullulans]
MLKSFFLAAASSGLAAAVTCDDLASSLTFKDVDVISASSSYYTKGSTINIEGEQSNACFKQTYPEVDMCRVVLTVATSPTSHNYMEVWLPSGSTPWNGRLLGTRNGGLAGCIEYEDMAYYSSLNFATVGDNGGHNSSTSDGSKLLNNNEAVIDLSYRSRHISVVAAKQVIKQYYSQPASYSYYVGCSTGGRQGLKSAQEFPDDFDGILAGSSASDFNHLSDWTSRFLLITGFGSDARALSKDQWAYVHEEVLAQCDEPLDGVADGILEDPTICEFNAAALQCGTSSDSRCLTQTQVQTVNDVYSELYDQNGNLLYPSLSLGAELVASQQGLFTGSVIGNAANFISNAVYNDSNWDPRSLSQETFTRADETDVLHGNISSWNGDLSAFRRAGGKLMMYHGMADPNIAGENSQRYYLHVAKTMGASDEQLDDFFRFYRISGNGHCSSGGEGAWEFGQIAAARNGKFSAVQQLVDWTEKGIAPDTITGTKFHNDDPSQGVAFERSHCRFPYRTTYKGNGLDPNVTSSWTCEKINNWQECGPGALPRLC